MTRSEIRGCKTSRIYIIGSGGHAKSVASMFWDLEVTGARSYASVEAVFVQPPDNTSTTTSTDTVIGPLGAIRYKDIIYRVEDSNLFIVAVGDNFLRQQIVQRIKSDFPNAEFPKLVHPSAVVSQSAVIADGSMIFPHAIVGANSIVGEFCIINNASSLDHDCRMGDFSSLAPGVHTGGNVQIGDRSFIGIGTSVKHKITIAEDSVIGGHSFVNRDVPECSVAYGVPAKVVRERERNERYF
jgi:sugar O-acyltransferase (sialic acid O-acetyltransferase NeuD family)